MEVTVTGLLRFATAEIAGGQLDGVRREVPDLPTQGIAHVGTDLDFELQYEGPSPEEAPMEGWNRLRGALRLAAHFAAGGSLRWWLDGEEFVEEAGSDLPVLARFPPKIRWLLRCVVGEDDEGVEGYRSQVDSADLPLLAEAYQHLQHDRQRAAFVLLVCDTVHPALEDVMLDALRLPDTEEDGIYAVAWGIALSHLKGDNAHEGQDRAELRNTIQVFLTERDRNANLPPGSP